MERAERPRLSPLARPPRRFVTVSLVALIVLRYLIPEGGFLAESSDPVERMVEPISHNTILASIFGTPPARPVPAAIATTTGKNDPLGRLSSADVYPQPIDIAELSREIFGSRSTKTTGGAPDRNGGSPTAQNLSEEEQAELRKLRQRDQEVRRHEQAHKAAAGSSAVGGPTFEYTTGPDGKRYATGGEVNIDTAEVPGDPQATIVKMQQIQQAANAPANPSSQDRAVAAQAAATERAAKAELAQQRHADSTNTGPQTELNLEPTRHTGETTDLTPHSSPTVGAFLNLIA